LLSPYLPHIHALGLRSASEFAKAKDDDPDMLNDGNIHYASPCRIALPLAEKG
jgi:hypothetical protein